MKRKVNALLVVRSRVAKFGLAAATYTGIRSTCPASCALRNGNGCYAESGFRTGAIVRRLDAARATSVQAARAEAALLREHAREVPKGYPLRLHVTGDCRTQRATKILADAARAWPGPVWTYTHAWQAIDRVTWGPISVLASIEDPRNARRAMRQGYAPALVVAQHETDRAFRAHGVRWIPCPEQTRGVPCSRCRLCFDADALRARGAGIAFAAHGVQAGRVRRRLPVLP